MSAATLADVFPEGSRPEPGSPHESYVLERLDETGRFGSKTLSELVRNHARERGERVSFTTGDFCLTWAELDALADRLALRLAGIGLGPSDRIAIIFPDGPTVHALYLAAERAGLVVVGIGPRAGSLEIRHVYQTTGATALVTAPMHRLQPGSTIAEDLRDAGLPLRAHLTVEPEDPDIVTVDGATVECDEVHAGLSLGLGDIWLVNSTSGTTGMPKCVIHSQNRWLYFHEQVARASGLTGDDVFLGMIPAPYGFGIWTTHVTPIVLGATTVLMPKFRPDQAIRLIESERVTAMACVTTQLIMILNAPEASAADFSALKVVFAGGEAIPYPRAAEAEDRMGAVLLNFYGSNETGFLSYTKVDDSRERRLTTGGRVAPEMRVRLFEESGEESQEGRGRAGARGPATSYGYYADPAANRELFTPDGWMLTGDICEVDDEGYLRVVGRTGDFIIRGGKNISAAAVEEQVSSHPAVALVAAVGIPDPVFGERVCVVVELQPGHSLTVEELAVHLEARGVSKESWPERLEVTDQLPRASGGKIAKGALRKQYGSPLRGDPDDHRGS